MNKLPVITISREYGSGGRAIGERVAKELGIPFYDKQLILMAAKESGLSEEYIKKTEQMKSTSFLSLPFPENTAPAAVPSASG